MTLEKINQIITDFGHERLSGSKSEETFAQFLKGECDALGIPARIEHFQTTDYRIEKERLLIDGKEIFCKFYAGCGSHEIEAPLLYLPQVDEFTLAKCKGKIILLDNGVAKEKYQKLAKNGALGLIIRNGSIQNKSKFIRRRELRFAKDLEKLIPCALIDTEDYLSLLRNGAQKAHLFIAQKEIKRQSPNVVAEIAGEIDEAMILAAHIDSTEGSLGVYDNLTGCMGLLEMAEYFAAHKPYRTIKFLWCGSEERGLLGSKAYCRRHKQELKTAVLNITLDMIGSMAGSFCSMACANKESLKVMTDFAKEQRFSTTEKYVLRSTDVKPFVYRGVPAISFARYAGDSIAPIHTEYDTPFSVTAESIERDSKYICAFTAYLANAKEFPIPRTIDKQMRKEAKEYMENK